MSDEPGPGGAPPPSDADATAAADASPFPSIDPLPDDAPPAHAKPAEMPPRLDLVLDIPVRLSVELGRTELPIREVVSLGRGSIVELDRAIGEPMDVRVNGILVGRGEIVVVNEERLGLRFTEVVSQAERATRLR
jgi:flagellar motor switch protein FliN/FliY